MKLSITLFLVFFSLAGRSSVLSETAYFEFHSDFWINLHHFLYQQAKGDQQKHLMEDGYKLVDIGEQEVYSGLSLSDQAILDEATLFYQKHWTDSTLLFDLAKLRHWLQLQEEANTIGDTAYSSAYTAILNRVAGVYRNNFWPLHQNRNREVLKKYLPMIREIETGTIKRLEQLAGSKWPEGKIRVDLSAYASWAGAYSQNYPSISVIISSLDPFATEPSLVETLFHEGTHMLFSRTSQFRSRIYYMSKEMDVKFPRGLWHACQFYLCGRLIQDKFAERGIKYELVMDEKNIFSATATPAFRSVLESYYQGRSDLEKTVMGLLLLEEK